MKFTAAFLNRFPKSFDGQTCLKQINFSRLFLGLCACIRFRLVDIFQSVQVLSGHMNRALATVTRRLHGKIALSEAEMMMCKLLATFKFDCPLPCLSVAEWQIVVAVILRALSARLLPQLSTSFDGSEGSGRMEQMLRPAGLDESRFDALGFVFSEDRQL